LLYLEGGIGGLGSYAIQYAKILGQSSTVIALDRTEEKLRLAEKFGADHVVNISESQNIRSEITSKVSGDKGPGIDAVIECVGAESTIEGSCRILNKGGAIVVVGLFGNQIKLPLIRVVLQDIKHMDRYGEIIMNYKRLLN
jgi:propanol-preferring alcohol dehydrogenase